MNVNTLQKEIYSYQVWVEEDGKMVMREIPCYTCGHCTSVIGLRPDRMRDRRRCKSCGKLLCEKNEICNKDDECIPLHSLVKDRWEAKGKWTRWLPAIMAGFTSSDEAERSGLVNG